MKDGDGQYMKPPAPLDKLKRLSTTQLEDSKFIIGDFRQMLVGIRNQVRIDISKEASDTSDSAFGQMQVWVRAFLRADVLAAHENHFSVLTGIV